MTVLCDQPATNLPIAPVLSSQKWSVCNFRSLRGTFSITFRRRWGHALTLHKRPNFLIIGAPKSASTHLHVVLRQHPKVYMPRDESPLFEDPFYNDDAPNELDRLFGEAPRGATLGLRSPTYLSKFECAPRIAQTVPEAKLIITLRNPVDRALADYYHKVRSGRLPVMDPNIGLMRIVSGDWKDKNVAQVLDCGLYANQISRYLDFFPREQLNILVSDSANSLPPKYFEQLISFIGLDPHAFTGSRSSRANVGIYNPGALRVIRTLSRIRHPKGESAERLKRRSGTVGRVVDFGFGMAIRGVVEFASRWTNNTRPVLTTETRKALCEYYRKDVSELQHILQMDLSRWLDVRPAPGQPIAA